jgi:leucyl/phenylalanyl-tRNA--protein transferase
MARFGDITGPFWLDMEDRETFPPVSLALREPDGLLAIGGDLSEPRLLAAYRHGVFPWYSEGQPILWWSPDPRCVLLPDRFRVRRSLRKVLRRGEFEVRFDTAFGAVIDGCAQTRRDGLGTWITDEMRAAYIRLHHAGYAHSVECWQGDQLVGGLYGLSIGRIFFGESMFSRTRDASKVALAYLVAQVTRWQFPLIDCQVTSEHLQSLGATCITRETFVGYLEKYCGASDVDAPTRKGPWHMDPDLDASVRLL